MTTHDWAAIVDAYKAGHLLAYPTEGVWGLGCDPLSETAVLSLLALKRRPISKGLIVLASDWASCAHWVDESSMGDCMALLPDWPADETWVFPATDAVPAWVSGDHRSVALRITAHPLAAELTRRCGGLLCSTSANLAGDPSITDEATLKAQTFASECMIVSGEIGGLGHATRMKDVLTGQYLR